MMFIHGIGNNILNYGTSISMLYQEESKIWEIYREINIYILGGNQTAKTDKTVVHVSPSILGVF